MSVPEDALVRARGSSERHDWAAARSAFLDLASEQPLVGEDLERLAWACRWGDDPSGFLDALEQAELAYSGEGERRGAARMALEQARHHKQMLNDAVSSTSWARAAGYLEGQPESAEHAHALWGMAWSLLEAGDFEEARATLEEAHLIAGRVGDDAAEALVLQGLAHLAVVDGRRDDGIALMDQATALAMRPGVAPIHAGHVYCSTISAYRSLCDWRRATEWTEVSTRYCARESITGYSGLCRFHQAEIDRLHGRLEQAELEVTEACDELLRINRYSAGWAFSELVEIRVRRGDLAGAEQALARAVELGSDGQPGRARLHLARGATAAALRGLERSLADAGFQAQESRVFLLPVHVTAALALGALDSARRSVAELSQLAERLGTPGPAASAAVARGQLALHQGDAPGAVAELTVGVRGWCEVDAPYEAAQARVALGRALRDDGDADAAREELEAARLTFEKIGAPADAALVGEILDQSEQTARMTATRTFLFSDIVGSTRLAEALGDDAWESLLAWHDRTLRAIFETHGANEVKHGGDGFFVTLEDADAALECAVDIQRALATHRATEGFAPAVRIGLHAGEATQRDGDFFGGAVIRASRIAAAADAGEILASADLLASCERAHQVVGQRHLELKGIAGPVEVVLIA